jgi:hypothetical protein
MKTYLKFLSQRLFPAVAFMAVQVLVSQSAWAGGDECCTDPGHVSDCWWEDAKRDGVSCDPSTGEILGSSNGETCALDCDGTARDGSDGKGLCTCEDDSDCGEVITPAPNGCMPTVRSGICTINGVCGPSYCNGFLICSCWGGCEESEYGKHQDNPEKVFSSPKEACDSHGIHCKEGNYSQNSSGKYLGYCTGEYFHEKFCEIDQDCYYDRFVNPDNPCEQCSFHLDAFSWSETYCNHLDNQCRKSACQVPEGCIAVPHPDGTVCNDSDLWTTNDHCLDGVCIGDAIGDSGIPDDDGRTLDDDGGNTEDENDIVLGGYECGCATAGAHSEYSLYSPFVQFVIPTFHEIWNLLLE